MTTATRTPVATPSDEALGRALRERVAELWSDRRWYRRQVNSAHWSPLRLETEAELRALLRLARAARRPALDRDIRAAIAANGYPEATAAPLTETELRAAYGDR